MKLNDREMLEDLIAAATNQALTKVREQLAEETAKMAASIGLPPGCSAADCRAWAESMRGLGGRIERTERARCRNRRE